MQALNSSADKTTEIYHFGQFSFDPVELRLRADGMPVALGATALKLLLALLDNSGALVSKEDLMARVWGYSDVGDNRLHVHINALRKIVGKDRIVTKEGCGYRFTGEVRRSERAAPFPAPRAHGNLPAAWTSTDGPGRLIGRGAQLRALSELWTQARCITLTGPGGVGKTRLAVQAAREIAPHFPDGVWLVELAGLRNCDLVPGTVASTLGVKIGNSEAPLNTLVHHLTRKTLLIVLDNCEHLIGACAQLCEALVTATCCVKILATSREALSCFGEIVFEVPPLDLPRDATELPETICKTAAIELFIERSMDARVWLDDDAVLAAARICRRLDGLPLAIEMVAGWASVLGLKGLEEKLVGSLQPWLRARSTAPVRHSTLRDTLEWSYQLLGTSERTILRRLALFANGFSLHAAETIAADDELPKARVFEHLGALIRKSMVVAEPTARPPRYSLLETTRAFALDKLTTCEIGTLRNRHARYVLRQLEVGLDEWERTGDAVWLDRYGALLDDVRAALDWTFTQESDDAVALAGASWPLWRQLSLHMEGRQRLSAAASLLRSATPPALEARLRVGLGELSLNPAHAQNACDDLSRAITLFRALGQPAELGATLPRLAFALHILERPLEAEMVLDEALTLLEGGGMLRALAMAYSARLCVEGQLGRFEIARRVGLKAEELCMLAGAGRAALVVAANLVEVSVEMGDLERAIADGRDLVARLRSTFHASLLAYAQYILAAALVHRGDLGDALVVASEAVPVLRDEGMLPRLFDHLALRAALVGRPSEAAMLLGYIEAAYTRREHPRALIEDRAVHRLNDLLGAAVSPTEIKRLLSSGSALREEQAITLALRN